MNIIKMPLLWFLIFGALLFAFDKNPQKSTKPEILITVGDIQRIKDQWKAQSGKPITAKVFSNLLKKYVEEQQLYREALSLGLDLDDVIIKRRLVQKVRFIAEDFGVVSKPSDMILLGYYEKNKINYKISKRISFLQIFFSNEARQENAFGDAQLALSKLLKKEASINWGLLGDPFMFGQTFIKKSAKELIQYFGANFVENIFDNPIKQWKGPIESSFGQHLISLEKFYPSRQMSFKESYSQVQSDYGETQKKLAYNHYLLELSLKYPVIFEDGISSDYISEDVISIEEKM